jgi:hypothetical protein
LRGSNGQSVRLFSDLPVLDINTMSTSDRLLVVGADFRDEENFTALKEYVTDLSLTSPLQITEDGNAVVYFDSDRKSPDVLASLWQTKHVINGHEVNFQAESEAPTPLRELPTDSTQKQHRQFPSLGRGRGVLRMTNPGGMQDTGSNANQNFTTGYFQDVRREAATNFRGPISPPSSSRSPFSSIHRTVSPQQLKAPTTSAPQVQVPFHRFPLSHNETPMYRPSAPELFTSLPVSESPLHSSSLSSSSYYEHQPTSYSPSATEFSPDPEIVAPRSPERKYPTEGLNVIQIKGLPEDATADRLKALLWETLSTNRTSRFDLEIVQWAPNDTRVYFEDIKGRYTPPVETLYRNDKSGCFL